MQSIRRRLTVGYIGALALTMTLFGVILYLDRRQASVRELDQRLEVEADLTLRYLQDLHRLFGRLPAVVEGTASYFSNFRDILVLMGTDGRPLLSLDGTVELDGGALARLSELAAEPLAEPRRVGTVALTPGQLVVRYVIVPVTGSDPSLATMLVAADLSEVTVAPTGLLRSMLVIAPVVLLVSVLLGYVLAGGSLKPLEAMIDELTAITDGRSLHRRLPSDPLATDEVARLVNAVNGMFARLEQSFAAQQRFVAEASHELKTPLMVLRAGVERALTNPSVPAESLQPLDESLEEVNRMTELVESLLTLARADEGRATLAVESCDLRELVSEAAETAQILAEVRGITVRTQIPERPVRLAVDRNRIRQLLLNLVTNAVKFTAAGGEVALGLADQDASVQLVVRDTGIGIAAGDLPHIFDRFWRADPARPRDEDRASGSGLGLAITKWIAEAHGGAISVQSRPGRGTIFTVTLPRPVPASG
jgi:heavy metal sensor kinase